LAHLLWNTSINHKWYATISLLIILKMYPPFFLSTYACFNISIQIPWNLIILVYLIICSEILTLLEKTWAMGDYKTQRSLLRSKVYKINSHSDSVTQATWKLVMESRETNTATYIYYSTWKDGLFCAGSNSFCSNDCSLTSKD
jgi:hypothetical protein